MEGEGGKPSLGSSAVELCPHSQITSCCSGLGLGLQREALALPANGSVVSSRSSEAAHIDPRVTNSFSRNSRHWGGGGGGRSSYYRL